MIENIFGKSVSKKSLIIISLLVTILFMLLFSFVFQVEYNELKGLHSWLSASTIKYVNMWLEEGASNLNFTRYESFNSIEFNSLKERTPYLSYPTGSTFLVYLTAKLVGVKHIDISFLKHFQMVCYCIEALILGIFIYLFVSNIGVKKEIEKIVITVLLALMWIVMPINVWYMANVYFADQSVILWVMAFVLFEYISKINQGYKYKLPINIIKCFIIYTGMLIDYYFWILVFFAFLFSLIKDIINREKISEIIKDKLWYVCPVFLGCSTFIWQLSFTDGWIKNLSNSFKVRTGNVNVGTDKFGATFLVLFQNFCNAFTAGSEFMFVCLVMFVIITMIATVMYVIKAHNIKWFFTNKNVSILLISILSVFTHILLLKNHSAEHEFSMIKVGFIIIILILVITFLLTDKSKTEEKDKSVISDFLYTFIICYFIIAMIIGLPGSISKYYDLRSENMVPDYSLAKIINENTDYNDVCYSFSYVINYNPPHLLSVSEKQVYLVNSVIEIDKKFRNLNKSANKILVVVKDIDLSYELKETQNTLMSTNKILYEDDAYCLVELKNY